MKVWLVLAAVLLAPIGRAQCPVLLFKDPLSPISTRPTVVRLQHWREHAPSSPPVILSVGKGNSILVEQLHNNLVPPGGFLPAPLCGVSAPLDLGVLAPGRYRILWRFRDNDSPVIWEQVNVEFLVSPPPIPTLDAPFTAMLILLVGVAGMLMARARM